MTPSKLSPVEQFLADQRAHEAWAKEHLFDGIEDEDVQNIRLIPEDKKNDKAQAREAR